MIRGKTRVITPHLTLHHPEVEGDSDEADMDLNSSSDEDDSPVPPAPAPVQAPGPSTVEEEEAWSQTEELDPRTLGVPGLRTLVPGDNIEVLWANGAFSPPCPAPQHAPDLTHLSHTTCAQDGRGGESRSACSRCGQAGPSSSTASRTMTASRFPPPALPHNMGPRALSQLTCTASRRATGGRGPAHAPGTASSRGGGGGGRALRPSVPEHAEK